MVHPERKIDLCWTEQAQGRRQDPNGFVLVCRKHERGLWEETEHLQIRERYWRSLDSLDREFRWEAFHQANTDSAKWVYLGLPRDSKHLRRSSVPGDQSSSLYYCDFPLPLWCHVWRCNARGYSIHFCNWSLLVWRATGFLQAFLCDQVLTSAHGILFTLLWVHLQRFHFNPFEDARRFVLWHHRNRQDSLEARLYLLCGRWPSLVLGDQRADLHELLEDENCCDTRSTSNELWCVHESP